MWGQGGVWGLWKGLRAGCHPVRGPETPWPQAPGLRDFAQPPWKPEAGENSTRLCQSVKHTLACTQHAPAEIVACTCSSTNSIMFIVYKQNKRCINSRPCRCFDTTFSRTRGDNVQMINANSKQEQTGSCVRCVRSAG